MGVLRRLFVRFVHMEQTLVCFEGFRHHATEVSRECELTVLWAWGEELGGYKLIALRVKDRE